MNLRLLLSGTTRALALFARHATQAWRCAQDKHFPLGHTVNAGDNDQATVLCCAYCHETLPRQDRSATTSTP